MILVAVAAAGCTSTSTVHAYHLTRYITVEGDAGEYDVLAGAHCPRLSRDGDGFQYDREWMEPVPETIVYEEWTGPGYERAAHAGSDHDWFRLGEALVQASLDGERTLVTLAHGSSGLLLDGAPVDLPWNATFAYTAHQVGGMFQVTETLALVDEGVRPLSTTTHWRLTCA